MRYRLYREQQLACSMEEAWDFFSSPNNLARITPKDMAFVVRSPKELGAIYEGLMITYTVAPVLSIPLKWITRITQVDYLKSFTDFQESGPYRYWNHFHEFVPNKEGVLIKDTVDYELPLGFLGRLAHAVFVRKKLHTIFAYRQEVLADMFNK